MPAVVVREVKPIGFPALLHELKLAGYSKGSWERIFGSDLLRIKAWKTKSSVERVKTPEITGRPPSRTLRR